MKRLCNFNTFGSEWTNHAKMHTKYQLPKGLTSSLHECSCFHLKYCILLLLLRLIIILVLYICIYFLCCVCSKVFSTLVNIINIIYFLCCVCSTVFSTLVTDNGAPNCIHRSHFLRFCTLWSLNISMITVTSTNQRDLCFSWGLWVEFFSTALQIKHFFFFINNTKLISIQTQGFHSNT